MSAASSAAVQRVGPRLRSLYRRFLRELPTRPPAALLEPSPLQQTIRYQISTPHRTSTSSTPSPSIPSDTAPPATSTGTTPESLIAPIDEAKLERDLAAADQYVQYLRAQRVHTTLLERYNPGMNLSEEDRIRMTARRVGMDLPVEMEKALERGNVKIVGGNREDGGGGGDGKG